MQVNSAIFLVVFKTSEQMYLVELHCMFVTVASQEIVIALFFLNHSQWNIEFITVWLTIHNNFENLILQNIQQTNFCRDESSEWSFKLQS